MFTSDGGLLGWPTHGYAVVVSWPLPGSGGGGTAERPGSAQDETCALAWQEALAFRDTMC